MRKMFVMALMSLLSIMNPTMSQEHKQFTGIATESFDSLPSCRIKDEISCFVQKAATKQERANKTLVKEVPLGVFHDDTINKIQSIVFEDGSFFSSMPTVSIAIGYGEGENVFTGITGLAHGKIRYGLEKKPFDDIPNPYFSIDNKPNRITGWSKRRKPVVGNWKVYRSKDNHYTYIYFRNERDGYEVTWVIKNFREYVTRVIDKLD